MSKSARGRLYVDREVQRALLWQLFRHWALFIVVLTGMLLALEALGSAQPRSLAGNLAAVWARHAPLFVVVLSLFPVFAYDSIKLSHRFVGPIVRLRGALRAAARGEPLAPLRFRQDDFWQDMAESFNELVAQRDESAERGHDHEAVAGGEAACPELQEV